MPSRSSSLTCPHCFSSLTEEYINQNGLKSCPSCEKEFQLYLFPHFFDQKEKGTIAERVETSSESTCFFHPDKKATVVCDKCGVFICSTCDIEVQGKHYCPDCFSQIMNEESEDSSLFQKGTTLYDGIALGLVFIPILPPFILFGTHYLTIFIAPAALIFSILFWNKTKSIVPRSKTRYVIAILGALALITLWVFIIAAFVWAIIQGDSFNGENPF